MLLYLSVFLAMVFAGLFIRPRGQQDIALGLFGVFLAYALDEWTRGLLMWRRWLRRDWLPHARAARRRIRSLETP